MSRSRRKTPIFGHAGESEKDDKRLCNRKIRRIAKEKLSLDPDGYLEPLPNEVYNVWSMAKDGKSYWIPKSDFNQYWLEKMMRK